MNKFFPPETSLPVFSNVNHSASINLIFTVWKFKNLSATQNLRENKLDDIRVSEVQIYFYKYVSIHFKIQSLIHSSVLISRKIRMAEKLLNFHTVWFHKFLEFHFGVYSLSSRRRAFLRCSSLIFRFRNTMAGLELLPAELEAAAPPKDGVFFSSNFVKRSECNVTLA